MMLKQWENKAIATDYNDVIKARYLVLIDPGMEGEIRVCGVIILLG